MTVSDDVKFQDCVYPRPLTRCNPQSLHYILHYMLVWRKRKHYPPDLGVSKKYYVNDPLKLLRPTLLLPVLRKL